LLHTPARDALAREIALLSEREIADAVAPQGTRARPVLHATISALARRPSARLGGLLARFDRQVASVGVSRAAREVVTAFGAELRVDGSCPASGPVLIAANHPGAYDALAMLAAIGRDDIAIVAADRPFLRAMPRLRDHLVFVADLARPNGASVRDRARGLRQALEWLAAGRVLVQFGAGAIEPDARFSGAADPVLGGWGDGTGLLTGRALRSGAAIVPCFVSGVHSPRAKRLFFVRWAERIGITTIAPLVQATIPGFRDVVVTVRFGSPIGADRLRGALADRDRTDIVRDAVERLAGRR
jgi:hypothetical protein